MTKISKRTKPVISVVIPAYNEEKLLPKCLKALRNQDFKKPFEIILVDNCSTDKTGEIGRKYECRVIEEPRKGQIYARQHGCNKADGTIIAVLDADNAPVINWLSIIYEELIIKVDGISALTGPYHYDEPVLLWAKIHEFLLWRPVFKLEHILFRSGRVIGGNVAFLKKNFIKSGGYDIRNNSIAESELGLSSKLGKIGKIKYAPNMIVSSDSRILRKGFLAFFYRYYIQYLVSYLLSKFLKKPTSVYSSDFR